MGTVDLQDYEVRLKDGVTYVTAEGYRNVRGWYEFYIGGKCIKRIPAAYVVAVL